jgi:tetratricopeptide (TPR) repeat protein
VSDLPSPAHSLAGLRGPAFRKRWGESTRLERSRDYAGAAALRKALAAELPEDVHLHWRIARDAIRAAEQLSPGEASRRRALYEEALEWAGRGRALDPTSGECCLYEFAARARLLAPAGSLPSPRSVRRVAKTLEACLERPPTWREGPGESELGNLYYGAATFYRRLPRSRWFEWVAGVRGDRERAVALGRRALSLGPGRIDFHVELGASLLCLAAERDDPATRAEGFRWLERTFELPERQPSDATDRQRARAMLDDPSRACGDSRVGFLRGG